MRKFFGLLLALTLAVGILPPAQASAAGSCLVAYPVNRLAVVYKFSSQVGNKPFYYVRGNATLQELDACIGSGAGADEGTNVLPANIEYTPKNLIWQLGYAESFAHGLGTPRFVYAYRSTNRMNWDRGPEVKIGHQYRFEITLSASGAALYKITDVNTGSYAIKFVGSATPKSEWGDGVWWGCEINDSVSGLGNDHNHDNINLRYLGYKFDGGSLWWRNGFNASDIWRDPALSSNNHTHLYWTGSYPKYDGFDCDTQQ